MSRIDEAMKRRTDDRPPSTLVASQAVAGADSAAIALDDYQPEPAADVTEAPLVMVEEPRHASSGSWSETSPLSSRLPVICEAPADVLAVAVEQYRRLAAECHEAQVERGVRKALVTSALPREGKTLTVTNLALTLSEAYERRVLLIDADLRRPSIDQVLGIANTGGLHECLEADAPASYVWITPRLAVLPAGRAFENPLAALSSSRMEAVIEAAATQFDWVLLDTPPVTMLPDVQHLVRLVDAVLLVIGAGTTPYDVVQRAVAEIGPDRIFGTILNRVQKDAIPLSGYYDHYYHHDTGRRA